MFNFLFHFKIFCFVCSVSFNREWSLVCSCAGLGRFSNFWRIVVLRMSCSLHLSPCALAFRAQWNIMGKKATCVMPAMDRELCHKRLLNVPCSTNADVDFGDLIHWKGSICVWRDNIHTCIWRGDGGRRTLAFCQCKSPFRWKHSPSGFYHLILFLIKVS